MAVETSKVKDRRPLRFETVDQALAEADRLAAAERAGTLKQVGNWTLGQSLGHLATWAEYSFTGAPLSAPFFVRWFLRIQKNNFLNNPMRAGVKIPRVTGGTLGIEPKSLDESLPRFIAAMRRLNQECPSIPNVVFGPLTHEEWIKLNLRHSELHLGFFVM